MKSKRLRLFDKAWKVFSRFIRQRDSGVCFTCGDTRDWKLQNAGHFIPRSSHSDTMFDEVNVNCQCVRCNKWLSGNLGDYAYGLIEKHGLEKISELRKRRDIVKRWKSGELEEIIIHYTNELNKYEL